MTNAEYLAARTANTIRELRHIGMDDTEILDNIVDLLDEVASKEEVAA